MMLNNIRNLVTRTFCRKQQPMRDAHLDIRPETMKLIRKLHRSRKTNVRTYFQKYTLQELSVLDYNQIKEVSLALDNRNERVVNYFKQYTPKELSDLSSDQMRTIAYALVDDKPNVHTC